MNRKQKDNCLKLFWLAYSFIIGKSVRESPKVDFIFGRCKKEQVQIEQQIAYLRQAGHFHFFKTYVNIG